MKDTTPLLATAIPEVKGWRTTPTILRFYSEYYALKKIAEPRIIRGIDAGLIHSESEVEILYLPISYETWWEICRWIRKTYATEVAESSRVRLYTERHVYEWKGGVKYLLVMSSPFRDKEYLRQYSQVFWKTDVTELLVAPVVAMTAVAPRRTKTLPPIKPLPPRPTR